MLRVNLVILLAQIENKKIRISDFLQPINAKLHDLPSLNKHTKNGTSMLCYHHVLGKCPNKFCKFAHVAGKDLPNEFVKELLTTLQPAMPKILNNHKEQVARHDRGAGPGGGPPHKKPKFEE